MHSPDIFEMNEIFQTSRPVIDKVNSDPHAVMGRLCDEVTELSEELDLYSRGKTTIETVGDEISDVMLFSCTLFRALGLDGRTMVKEKIGQNTLKSPASRLQTGDYHQIYPEIRSEWKETNGYAEFNKPFRH